MTQTAATTGRSIYDLPAPVFYVCYLYRLFTTGGR